MKKRNIDRVMSFHSHKPVNIVKAYRTNPLSYCNISTCNIWTCLYGMNLFWCSFRLDIGMETCCMFLTYVRLYWFYPFALLTSGSTLIQVGYILPCWLLRFTKRLSTFYIMVDLHRSLCLHSPILGMLRNWTRVNWRDGWTKRKPWKTVANLKT